MWRTRDNESSCFSKPAQNLLLRIGATDFNASATDPKRGVDRTASFTIVHPGFDPNSFVNDVALIRMSNPVQFNQFIKPICMPSGPPQPGVIITPSLQYTGTALFGPPVNGR